MFIDKFLLDKYLLKKRLFSQSCLILSEKKTPLLKAVKIRFKKEILIYDLKRTNRPLLVINWKQKEGLTILEYKYIITDKHGTKLAYIEGEKSAGFSLDFTIRDGYRNIIGVIQPDNIISSYKYVEIVLDRKRLGIFYKRSSFASDIYIIDLRGDMERKLDRRIAVGVAVILAFQRLPMRTLSGEIRVDWQERVVAGKEKYKIKMEIPETFLQEQVLRSGRKCKIERGRVLSEERVRSLRRKLLLPRVSVGYVIGIILLLVNLILPTLIPDLFKGRPNEMVWEEMAILLIWLLWLLGFVYWLICVYRIHKVLYEVTAHTYPIKPARAVGFHLLPFYNLYWFFKWSSEVVKFINVNSSGKKLKKGVPGTLIFLGVLLSDILGKGIGLILMFSAIDILIRNIKKVVRNSS